MSGVVLGSSEYYQLPGRICGVDELRVCVLDSTVEASTMEIIASAITRLVACSKAGFSPVDLWMCQVNILSP